jgi:hypothetical protein
VLLNEDRRIIPVAYDDMNECELNAWIGSRYEECGRVLILLESTYGNPHATQRGDVLAWASGSKDPTFQKIWKANAQTDESRLDLFNRLACMNLWPEPIGANNQVKVSEAQLRLGARTLVARLDLITPEVIWIASKRAADSAKSVLQDYPAKRIIETRHPSRASYECLRNAWDDCMR